MNYKVSHCTTYQYSSPVSVCHNVVMLSPRAGDHLRVNSHRLTIRPTPDVTAKRVDIFGNIANRFSLEQNHHKLVITATSRVTVLPRQVPLSDQSPTCREIAAGISDRSDPNWLAVAPFLFDSPRIQRSGVFAEFAAKSVNRDKQIVAAVTDLTHQIYTDFKYDKKATHVDTPTQAAFDGRHGVCQDFAHIAVACLRSVDLPARYVSGYLRSVPPPGQERLVGADQSHAWLSVYCGSELGWIDFDPTNDCICGMDHIPVAMGRDYSDVVPIRGVFLGGDEPVLSVSVDVAPEES